tara:strand:+ start:14182 stop:14478 length:297 start_codon:yes stop_codon:yes gene_type:complete
MPESIDITPTPAEAARIARLLTENAYELPTNGLGDYQLLWAWSQAEAAADRIEAPLAELPRRLGKELLRLYLARAHHVPDKPITDITGYDDLEQENGR